MEADENIFCYERVLDEKKLLVVCNFSDKELPFVYSLEWKDSKLLISNMTRRDNSLNPYEAFVLEL